MYVSYSVSEYRATQSTIRDCGLKLHSWLFIKSQGNILASFTKSLLRMLSVMLWEVPWAHLSLNSFVTGLVGAMNALGNQSFLKSGWKSRLLKDIFSNSVLGREFFSPFPHRPYEEWCLPAAVWNPVLLTQSLMTRVRVYTQHLPCWVTLSSPLNFAVSQFCHLSKAEINLDFPMYLIEWLYKSLSKTVPRLSFLGARHHRKPYSFIPMTSMDGFMCGCKQEAAGLGSIVCEECHGL